MEQADTYTSPAPENVTGEPDQSQNPALSMVQPMNATLYFDNVEGFGEWSILLSTRAQNDLRDFKCNDDEMFQIAMKKTKWAFTLHSDDRC